MISRISKKLVDAGLLTEDQLNEALVVKKAEGKRLETVLVEKGYVPEDKLMEFLSALYEVPYVDLKTYPINPAVVRCLDADMVRKYIVMPVDRTEDTITIAMTDPSNIFVVDDVKFMTKLTVKAVLATENDIRTEIEKNYGENAPVNEEATQDEAKAESPRLLPAGLFARCIRQAVRKEYDEPTREDLAGVTKLTCYAEGLRSLDGVQLLPNLRELCIEEVDGSQRRMNVRDLSALSGHPSLNVLQLKHCRVSLETLDSVPQLRELTVEGCQVSSLRTGALPELAKFRIDSSTVREWPDFGKYPKLRTVDLGGADPARFTSIEHAGQIEELTLKIWEHTYEQDIEQLMLLTKKKFIIRDYHSKSNYNWSSTATVNLVRSASMDEQSASRRMLDKIRDFFVGENKKKPAIVKAPQFGDMFVSAGLITDDQLREAIAVQKAAGKRLKGKSLVQILIQTGHVPEDKLMEVLGKRYGVPYVDLNTLQIDPDQYLMKNIPADVAQKYRIMPINRTGATITVAMADPSNTYAIKDIEFMTGYKVEVVLASEEAVFDSLRRHYSIIPPDIDSGITELMGDLQPCFL